MNIDQFEGEEEQEPNKEMKIKLLDQLIEDIMALPDAEPKAEVENPADGVDPIDGGGPLDKKGL